MTLPTQMLYFSAGWLPCSGTAQPARSHKKMLWATHLCTWRKAQSFLFHSHLDPNFLLHLCIYLGPDLLLDLLFRPRLDVKLGFFILILKHSPVVVIVVYSCPGSLPFSAPGHFFLWLSLAPWTSSLPWSAWLVPPTSPGPFSRG